MVRASADGDASIATDEDGRLEHGHEGSERGAYEKDGVDRLEDNVQKKGECLVDRRGCVC